MRDAIYDIIVYHPENPEVIRIARFLKRLEAAEVKSAEVESAEADPIIAALITPFPNKSLEASFEELTLMENMSKFDPTDINNDELEEYEVYHYVEVTEAMVLNGDFGESYGHPADTPEGKEERDTLFNDDLTRLIERGINEQEARTIIAQAPFHMMKVHNIMVRAEYERVTAENAARHVRNQAREIRAHQTRLALAKEAATKEAEAKELSTEEKP